MISSAKTALGIDISEHRISIALLKKTKKDTRLLKADDIEMPKEAIIDGNIANPALVAGAIKKLLRKNRIRLRQAVISLVAKPVLNQIVELPEDIPANVGQFVKTEIKHSPVLSGKEPQFDFCRLASSGQNDLDRVFVGATDGDKIADILKVFSIAAIEPISIELPAMSAVRAIYSQKITNRYDSNVLVALLHGSIMTICVFRKDELDFVRSVDLAEYMDDNDNYFACCEREIDTVIQYYDVEVDSAEDKWEILAILENPKIEASDLEFTLQKRFGLDANVCSSDAIYSSTPLAKNDNIRKCSITAVGLAMRAADIGKTDFAIDLIPAEEEEKKATKKFVLLTANLAAVMLLCIFIIAGFVRVQLGKTQEMMEKRKLDSPQDSIEQLLAKQRIVNDKIAYLTDKKTKMNKIFEGDTVFNWADVLDEIRNNVPTTLYITKMSALQGSDFIVEGNARSFKSIHIFAELLRQSDFIQSAVVAQTEKNSRINGMVAYTISCVLSDSEGI